MKVLIAGCGYVGTALGAELAGKGHEVFGMRRSTALASQLAAASIQLVQGDVSVPRTLENLPRGCDWIVHCASAGGGLEEYRRVYVDGLRNLIEWAAPQRPRKFVYTSSTGVYGQDDGSQVDETSVTDPAGATGKILVEAERLVLDAAAETGFPGLVLRLAGIYGPGRGYWLRQFLAGEARLEGDGGRVLNMIHRDDAAGAIAAALEQGSPGSVYNVVDNEPVTQLEMFKWLSQKLSQPLPPVAESPSVSKRAATNKAVSNRRLRTELRYKLRYPTFREGFSAEL